MLSVEDDAAGDSPPPGVPSPAKGNEAWGA